VVRQGLFLRLVCSVNCYVAGSDDSIYAVADKMNGEHFCLR